MSFKSGFESRERERETERQRETEKERESQFNRAGSIIIIIIFFNKS